MLRYIFISAFIFTFISTSAFADTIANRLGVTGRLGFATPLKDDFVNGTAETKTGFAGGGGFIYSFGNNLATEVDVIHLPKLDVNKGGIKAYEATITDIGLGLQYRIIPDKKVVPYIGAGFDFIKGSLKHVSGSSYDLDWTYGGHLNAGVDWFLNSSIALTAEARGTLAASGDILSGSTKVGEYNPFWVQGTVGVRLFLPKEF